jgi:hypothetical protein
MAHKAVTIQNIKNAGPMPAKDYKKDNVADNCAVLSSTQIFWFMQLTGHFGQ